MKNKIKIGIIGMGTFGKTHLSIWESFEDVEVVAVADIDKERLKEMKNQYKTYSSLELLVQNPDIDVVDIVTPEGSHGEQVELALHHDKHVFVEKPLTMSSKHAKKLMKIANEKELFVMTGNSISRFSQPYYLMKKNQGQMGEIATIRSKRNCSRAWFEDYGHRVHAVYETGIHDIDIAIWIAESKCKRIYASERNITGYMVPDAMMAMLEFENGVIAHIESSWLIPNSSPKTSSGGFLKGTLDIECEVVGTKQTTKIDLANTGLTIWGEDEVYHPEYSIWPEEFGQIGGALRKMLKHYVNELQSENRSEYVKLEDSVHGLQIAEAIIKSAVEKRPILL